MLYISKVLSLVVLLTSLTLQACGGGGGSSSTPATQDPITPAPDTTKPVISLNGEASLSIEQGATYTEANATAMDAVDGSVDVVITGTVDKAAGTATFSSTDIKTLTEGGLTLTVVASDAAGNEGPATMIDPVDATAPTVQITGVT